MTSFLYLFLDPRILPTALLDVQIAPRIWHQMIHYSRHLHYVISLAAPWRHSGITLESPWRHPLQALLYFAYLSHFLYSLLYLRYINDSFTHYRTTSSPLLKRNQQAHIHDAIVYYYAILLYTYLKPFTSMFHEYTMMTFSLVTSILQEHSNYWFP